MYIRVQMRYDDSIIRTTKGFSIMPRYEIAVDASTDDAIDTLAADATDANVTFANFEITNPNDFGVPIVAFDALPDDVRAYISFYDIDDDVIYPL